MAQVRRVRPSTALALLAAIAVALVLAGCNQIDSPFARLSSEPKLADADEIGAISQWSAAYAKKPRDPKMALGYAMALKAIGSRDRALEVLTAGYRANPDSGEIAAELGRLALDMNRLDIASQTLNVAEAEGVNDWRTLSAQGTLRAKQGKHAEAQQYYLAALKEQPEAVSVINNLALSYALDGKADQSEELLRKAVASGKGDTRVRQNLAMVLGLQGKFEEARQVASVDMTEQESKSSMSYLRNMLSNSTQLATAKPGSDDAAGDDWKPFASNDVASSATPSVAPKVQLVKAAENVEAPSATTLAGAAQPASPAASAKPSKVAGTPTLIMPVNATTSKIQASVPTASAAQGDPAGLLRTDTD